MADEETRSIFFQSIFDQANPAPSSLPQQADSLVNLSTILSAPVDPSDAMLRAFGLLSPFDSLPQANTLANLSTILSPPVDPSDALLRALGLLSPPVPPSSVSYSWRYVIPRFTQLAQNLSLTELQTDDGATKQAGLRDCLNRHYWGIRSGSANSLLIGSWGKRTNIRPPNDVDVLFTLPPEVYWRFEARSGNRQAHLLSEVKSVLSTTYPQTRMRQDGQVVIVPFNTTIVEISIGFRCRDDSIIVCNTNDGGSYMASSTEAEARELSVSDRAWNGNTRALVRMIKQWQREKNVPLKSFWIERLAVEFLSSWPFRDKGIFYYDWMIRDFLKFLLGRENGFVVMPGTFEIIYLGSDWVSRARTAYAYAVRACDYERDNSDAAAGSDWQEIFGNMTPIHAS